MLIMGFALEPNEPLSEAVRRIAIEEVDVALHHLKGPAEDLNKSVHGTRQSLKRICALLALARDDIGVKVFEREWRCYRTAGKLLSVGRDAAVVVDTLDALVERFSSELSGNAYATERSFLAGRRDTLLQRMVEEGALAESGEMLEAARTRVAKWPLRDEGFDAVRVCLKRSYRSGLKGLTTVIRDPSPTNFHDWRRPVKLLWHQLQILTPIWPVVMNAHSEELHALSDRLNANHDLDVLRGVVLELETEPEDRRPLTDLIELRCRELEAEALPLGERLYTERPRLFVDRLESYWQTWQNENRDAAVTARSGAEIAASSTH